MSTRKVNGLEFQSNYWKCTSSSGSVQVEFLNLNRSCDQAMYNLRKGAPLSTDYNFVISIQMTLVRRLHVKITDHVLPMDLQDIFVNIYLDIQALVVKVRYKLNTKNIHIYIKNTKSFPKAPEIAFQRLKFLGNDSPTQRFYSS